MTRDYAGQSRPSNTCFMSKRFYCQICTKLSHRILDKQNIFGHPCRHMLASKMPTHCEMVFLLYYTSWTIIFHCKLKIRHFHGDPQPHNLPSVQEASDQVQNFCFAPKHSSILQRRAAVAGGGSKTVEMLS